MIQIIAVGKLKEKATKALVDEYVKRLTAYTRIEITEVADEPNSQLEDNKVKNVQFMGGCNGNTQGVARLVEGMDVNEAISRLEGIQCGFRGTSCPDQLAQAIKQAIEQ